MLKRGVRYLMGIIQDVKDFLAWKKSKELKKREMDIKIAVANDMGRIRTDTPTKEDPKLPTSIKSVAIPVTDSMIKTFQAVDLSVKMHPVVTTKNILSSLLGVNYLDDTSSDLVVFNIKYDQKTDSREAVIKGLRSFKEV